MKAPSFFLSALLLVLCNCAPSVVLNSRWTQTQFSGKTLAIVLPEEKIEVRYAGNVENEFGKGDKNTLIRDNFKNLLLKRTQEKTFFKDAWFDQIGPGMQTIVFKASDGVTMPVPKDMADIELINKKADYILCFDYVRIATSVAMEMTGGMGSYSKYLNVLTRFYIWDTNQKCLVVSGYSSNRDDNGLYTSMTDWIRIIDMTVKEVFEKPSFLIQTNQRN